MICAAEPPLALIPEQDMQVTDVIYTIGSVFIRYAPVDRNYTRWTMDEIILHT